jgi:hypothetical protein
MSFRTIEVDVVNGRVQPTGADQLPDRARGLLTLIDEPKKVESTAGDLRGLKRFLELPDIPISREQLREIMESDYYDQ